MQELEKILEEIDEHAFIVPGRTQEYIAVSMVKDILRKYVNDGWVPIDERLPEDEAKKYIDEELNGIGYLYPCLLTYRSPITERIHVVKLYYDIYDHWFVNAREDVCEKDRCIAWRPLPEPYRLERSEEE